jgi:four helix bundle protein
MFLQLAHTQLKVFQQSPLLALECYKITKQFPSKEKFGLIQQIRRAAISVHLNIAENVQENRVGSEKDILKSQEVR